MTSSTVMRSHLRSFSKALVESVQELHYVRQWIWGRWVSCYMHGVFMNGFVRRMEQSTSALYAISSCHSIKPASPMPAGKPTKNRTISLHPQKRNVRRIPDYYFFLRIFRPFFLRWEFRTGAPAAINNRKPQDCVASALAAPFGRGWREPSSPHQHCFNVHKQQRQEESEDWTAISAE